MKADKKFKGNLGYNIFYVVALIVILVIGLFSNSFFAYEIFNSLFFDILYLILTIALLAVRSIQTFLRQTARYGKVFTLTYFNLFALIFAIRPFVTGRIWAILLFVGFIVSVALLLILAFKYIKNPDLYFITRFEPLAAMVSLILLLFVAMIQNYVGAEGMWIPIVIIGMILSAAAVCIFLKYFKNIDHFRTQKSEIVSVIILIIAAAFYVSGVTVTTINYGLDSNPTAVSVEITEKNIHSGARQATTFNFTVKIDGQEKEIDVPVDVYHSKEIGDSVEIKFYKGALGYSYYIFEYIGTG